MSRQLLNLPINIPWCQIAVTENMMDTGFGDRRFPAPWRSSIAISAYEPKIEDLPEEFSGKRITYLKVTCSITGYQPTRDETLRGFADLDDGSTAFRQILDEYLACYGVLLNVAVFPAKKRPGTLQVGDDDLANYPHIIAFEPKNRDLYQAATESGEVLTASNSRLATDKTISHTESTETGLSVGGTGAVAGVPISASLTRKWGETAQDSRSIQADNSRERRETQGTTTQLSQMYNLLTGYHQGTNRATFLMLPRPHTLQPTDLRTFVQGLREIEGVQEFMLIVERPAKIDTLCVEAFLETGHYPEDVAVISPDQSFSEKTITRPIDPKPISVKPFLGFRRSKSIAREFYGLESDGYEFDPRYGENTIEEEILPDDNAGGKTAILGADFLTGYDYSWTSPEQQPGSLVVKGKIESRRTESTTFHRKYHIHLRRPGPSVSQPKANVTDLLITSRGLDVCFQPGEGCPVIVKDSRPQAPDNDGFVRTTVFKESIVDERKIEIDTNLLAYNAIGSSRLPAQKELLRQIQNAMTTSGRLPDRYPAGRVSFLESDYFKNRVTKLLPRERMETHLGSVEGLPYEVIKNLGEECTIAEALQLDLPEFMRKTGLSLVQAAKARRDLLGLRKEAGDDAAAKSDQSYSGS
jgi:hypothetical protein